MLSPARLKAAARHRIGGTRPHRVAEAALWLGRLEAALARRPESMLMAYDLKASPLTYGDWVYFVMLARWAQVHGVRTDLVVVDDTLRDDVAHLSHDITGRLGEYERIATALSVPGRVSVGFARHDDLVERVPGPVYPARGELERRRQVYPRHWRMMQYGLTVAPPKLRRAFLLHAAGVAAAAGFDLPAEPYALISIRAGSEYSEGRDVEAAEYERQIAAIRSRFPDLAIMVAADAAGTRAVKSWGIDAAGVRFTKDLGTGYIEDLALALGARFYVQLRGGGLMAGVVFSRTPYFLAARDIHSRFGQTGSLRAPRWSDQRSVWCPPGERVWPEFERFLDRLRG